MPVIGEIKNVYGRSYVYINPNDTLGPGTWVLNGRDLFQTDSGDDASAASGSGTVEPSSSTPIIRGNILAVNGAGNLILAQADSLSNCNVVGVALSGANPGQNVQFSSDAIISFTNVSLVLEDNSTSLELGKTYFLSRTNPGEYTDTPDTTTTGSVVLAVAKATGSSTIDIEIQQPVVI